MSTERPGPSAASNQADPGPITSLHDPRALQILSTEHWSLLTARSLAYNEAFTRGGMFLTFLSMSFVGLALLASAMSFSREFLALTAIVLGFAFVIGLTTFSRVSGANADDLRAMHAMARIRHGYLEAAPMLAPYFSTATTDAVDRVLEDYGAPPAGGAATVAYGLSTSLGMLGLILSMLGGVELAVVALLVGASPLPAAGIGVICAALILIGLIALTLRRVAVNQRALSVRFPESPGNDGQSTARASDTTPH